MKKGANFSLKDVPPEVEFEPLTLLAEDGAVSRGMLYRPRGKRPKVGVHPSATFRMLRSRTCLAISNGLHLLWQLLAC